MEGPQVRIASEDMAGFKGRRIRDAHGNAKIDMDRVRGKLLNDVYSRGKQLLLDLGDPHIRVHFMMFGSYMVNRDRNGQKPRLALDFGDGAIRFYNCSVRLVDGNLDEGAYDPQVDITGAGWNLERVLSLVSEQGSEEICDVLMDQEVFGGVGNMIKNEALYRSRIHPLSISSAIPIEQMKELLRNTREFSLELYEVERRGKRISGIFDVYRIRDCRSCGGRVRMKKTGKRDRVSYFCPNCQVLYS